VEANEGTFGCPGVVIKGEVGTGHSDDYKNNYLEKNTVYLGMLLETITK